MTPAFRKKAREVWAALSARPGSSIRELQRATGVSSTNVVYRALQKLVKLGYVQRAAVITPGSYQIHRRYVVVIPLLENQNGGAKWHWQK